MTIAVSVKVSDGVVLATDSAATMMLIDSNGHPVATVYNNANKIVNLRKGFPIGVMICGVASVGLVSVYTILKDLRRKLTAGDPKGRWHFDSDSYRMADVAQLVSDFLVEEHIDHFKSAGGKWQGIMQLGVAGFSTGEDLAEVYQVLIDNNGNAQDVTEISPCTDSNSLYWAGQGDAVYRLIFGVDPQMPRVLKDELGVADSQVSPTFEKMKEEFQSPLIIPAMPIQDAIDLADFLADTAAKYTRFHGGPATVGGTIEIAAITKHEGFKWVRRKYYYDRQFNPEETV